MCLPLAVAAGAISAAGALTSGVQGMMAANYEGEVARRNAALEVERARDSTERGRWERRAFFRDIGQLKGQQTASMAANGIDVGFGSAERTAQDTAMLADEDARTLYSNINERTRGFDINASNVMAERAAARQRKWAIGTKAVFDAGSSLMGGLQQQRALDLAQNPQSLMGGFTQQRGMRARLGIGG